MYISCLLGFIILFSYLGYIIYKDKKIPSSISQTIFSLNEKNRWVFTIIMFIVAILIAPQLFTLMQPFDYEILAFMTALGIFGVGADPLDADEKDIVHYVSSVIVGVPSQLMVYIINPWCLVLWIPYVIYTLYTEDGSKNMLFGEIVMVLSTALICLLK